MYLQHLPTALCGLAILIAFTFHRGRVFLIALVLGLGWWAASHDRAVLLPLFQILYCFNVMIFIWVQERGLISAYGIWRLGLVAVQFGLFLLLYTYSADGLHNLLYQRWLDSPLIDRMHLSQPGLFIIIPALILIGVRLVLQPTAIHAAMLVSVLAVLMAGFRPDIPHWMISYIATAALILIFGLLQDSYRMAFHDELTGLPSRRALQHRLATLGNQYTIAMVDVDHFKQFNDTYGHDVGDQVLKMVAGHLQRVAGGGKAYRYGGEEFTIVFPRKTIKQSIPHLSDLRKTIEGYTLSIRGRQRPKRSSRGRQMRGTGISTEHVSVTVSIGVAECNDELHTPKQVMGAADQALYRAKADGRNRISR